MDRGVPAGWNNLCDLVGEVRVSLKSRGLSSESLIVVWNPSLNFLGHALGVWSENQNTQECWLSRPL